MNIVGVSAFYHESACCLLQDGRLIAAAAEERFTRLKHDARLPTRALRYCLEAGGLTIADVDCVAYYESPHEKRARQRWALTEEGVGNAPPLVDADLPERLIRTRWGYSGPIHIGSHHRSHAASAFFCSGWDRAAILTVDGVGEWATTTYGRGCGAEIEIIEEVRFPHSLGLLYATLTAYLGFRVNHDEYKVMGLAAYGRPRFASRLWQLVDDLPGGQFALNLAYFDFVAGRTMYSPKLVDLLGQAPRTLGAGIEPFHADVAASIQSVLEDLLLRKASYLQAATGEQRLCMAGGVALNSVANGRLRRAAPFADMFIQPAAGDAGACLGAAALAHVQLTGLRPEMTLHHAYLGPAFDHADIAGMVREIGPLATDFTGRTAALLEAVVDRLTAGQAVGWFHGRMEFGPRALGARSILADPTNPDLRDRLNRLVKGRELFRPFAPSVLLEHAADYFDLRHPSPFMLETCAVRQHSALPAVTHVDGSARPQTVDRESNPRFAALLDTFHRRTGCPVLLNTSFNQADEPIVCTPADALFCFVNAGLDALVLEDWLLERTALPAHWPELAAGWRVKPAGGTTHAAAATDAANLYTFV